jgi:hypothetical protein
MLWTAGSWSFPAFVLMACWDRRQESAALSGALPARAMRALFVVVSAPIFKFRQGVFQAEEAMGVQALRPEAAVKRLDVGIVRRLPRSTEVKRDGCGCASFAT